MEVGALSLYKWPITKGLLLGNVADWDFPRLFCGRGGGSGRYSLCSLVNAKRTQTKQKKHRINSHEWAVRANERTDERVAQYFSLYSWSFWPTVLRFFLVSHFLHKHLTFLSLTFLSLLILQPHFSYSYLSRPYLSSFLNPPIASPPILLCDSLYFPLFLWRRPFCNFHTRFFFCSFFYFVFSPKRPTLVSALRFSLFFCRFRVVLAFALLLS